MNQRKPYRTYADMLAEHFPGKVQKLPVDGGFTCPNRDGTKGRGGCLYCANRSFHPAYGKASRSIREQLEEGKRFFSGQYAEMKYLAYFQSYTNTYAPLDVLRARFEEALSVPDVVGLVISTRPDCLPDEVLDYLSDLRQRTFVMVELGVESTDDEVLRLVNRCHTFADSEDAIRRTAARGIPVCAHFILGLPRPVESCQLSVNSWHVSESLRISKTPISSIKFHQLQILRGTAMARLYQHLTEEVSPKLVLPCLSLEAYLDTLTNFIVHLRPDIAIERFVSQSPPGMLIAPKWGVKPDAFTALLEKHLQEKDAFQGKYFTSL